MAWSPCGRFFLTASVAPRMRVDNRITVFTYFGEEVANLPYEELRGAQWKPQPAVRPCSNAGECYKTCMWLRTLLAVCSATGVPQQSG